MSPSTETTIREATVRGGYNQGGYNQVGYYHGGYGGPDGYDDNMKLTEASDTNFINEYDRQLTSRNTHEQGQLQHIQTVQGQLETFVDMSNQQLDINRQDHIAHREATDEHARAMSEARMEQMSKRAADYRAEKERKLQAQTEAMLAKAAAYKKKKEQDLDSELRQEENRARMHAVGQANIVDHGASINTSTINLNSSEYTPSMIVFRSR